MNHEPQAAHNPPAYLTSTHNREPRPLKIGDRVRYTPVKWGNHDGRVYTVRAIDVMEEDGAEVVWLEGKAGCVARWAVFPERGSVTKAEGRM